MSDETTLLPCPHCECDTPWLESAEHTQGLRWYVFCHVCGAMGGWKPTATEAIAAWNTRDTHGTLTAEQVREAVMSADRWEKPMGNTGLTNTHLIIRDDGWQAIADELNDELGSGTCRITASATDGLCSDSPRQRFELSCGHSFTLDGLGAPVACAVCGKAVER